MRDPSIDTVEALWACATAGARRFQAADLVRGVEPARRYLAHAITEGAVLARAVRLRMHGEIRLRGWCPFTAEEAIVWDRGLVWQARVRVGPVAIRGGDRYVDGRGAMRWRIFGIIPMIDAASADITRSAAGRMNVESIWLPAILADSSVAWSSQGPRRARARFDAHGERADIELTLDDAGALRSVCMPRWGNPDGGAWRAVPCGAVVEDERRFGDYTLPSRLRVGWHCGSDRFEKDGEFFRVTIDAAEFR